MRGRDASPQPELRPIDRTGKVVILIKSASIKSCCILNTLFRTSWIDCVGPDSPSLVGAI